MSRRFARWSVVVTGASSGIGRALALGLGAEGARLVLGGRSQARLDEVAAKLRAAGSEAHALAGDVREEAVVRSLVARALDAFGGLDVMVNNAGVAHPGSVLEGDSEDWRELFETNALALFVGCREAARAMAGGGGILVNVSSLAGRDPTPGDAVYSASKHAVHAFSAALRVELAESGVRVVVVEPGQTMTSIGRSLPVARVRELAASLGMDPDEVPDFEGSVVPPEFAERVQRSYPHLFLSPEQVARAVIEALAADPVPETVRVVPR